MKLEESICFLIRTRERIGVGGVLLHLAKLASFFFLLLNLELASNVMPRFVGLNKNLFTNAHNRFVYGR